MASAPDPIFRPETLLDALERRDVNVIIVGAFAAQVIMSEADWIDAKRTPPVREKDARHIASYERWRAGRRS